MKKGFTLSELLLAAAILAFVLCALLYSFISCMLLNEANRNLTGAVIHAEYVMEEMRNVDFSLVSTNIAAGYWDWNNQTIAAKGLTALRNETIDTQASGTDPLDVTVTVSWQDRNARNRSMSLETLISRL